ncbi:MAG TPA: T9SS type A sorting domain-containing protein [Saprospiraceae bacterium]|nr:T9SS type A sorting domain-containing protein [Saprospiraceae bacterium]
MLTRLLLIHLFSIILVPIIHSQSCRDVSVELSADVQTSPPRITLNWIANDSTTGYFINRKLKTANGWGQVIATLDGSETQFIDTTVMIGVSYEYRVVRQANAFSGYGYINSGINIPATENRGILILLADSTLVDSLADEITRLINDFIGDGWKVNYRIVSRNTSVADVKTMIVNIYNASPATTKAVFILGHVAVPYSGEINVDGHDNHTGAYPADVYYADVNGNWTDVAVNNITAADPRNQNVPKDGKFDQGFIPSDLELQIGRVDFFNMPTFIESEQELLRNYLDKDHAYRQKEFTVEHRMLIDDNFGYFGGEAFALSGWRNGGPIVGPDNVVAGDYFPDMTTSSYLWSYGCGGGWYQGAGGVGTTMDFANSNLQSVFTMLFGSYFGDWDTQDNFLRAALAQGKTLTNVWSGRPHWEFHHMALGESIGYDVRLSQNNNALYTSNFGGRLVHMAFMGDPTLRNDIIAPPSNLVITKNGYHAELNWNASADSILGYHVYRKAEFQNDFYRVNDDIITNTFYTDSCLFLQGVYSYIVRAVRLEKTPSGTYYNLSQGVMQDVLHIGDPTIIAHFDYEVNDNVVTFTNNTHNATSYLWYFDDGQTSTEENPMHIYSPGIYDVKLIAYNECDVDSLIIISITVEPNATNESLNISEISVSPNPSKGDFQILTAEPFSGLLKIFAITGELVYKKEGFISTDLIDLNRNPNGVYTLSIQSGRYNFRSKIIINR